MNRISINLSPKKETATTAAAQNIISYTPLVVLAGLAIFTILLFMQVIFLKKNHTHGIYKKEWAQWEHKAIAMRGIKDEITLLDYELCRLRKISTPGYGLGYILADMFSALPKNIWFESLRFKEEVIELRGYVVKWNEDYLISLDTFINALGKSDYFSSRFGLVNIKTSQKEDFNGVKVLNFSIECKK